MTIREVQELLEFTDEKNGKSASPAANAGRDDVCRRFCETVRDANAAGIDLTESFVDWLADKKRP